MDVFRRCFLEDEPNGNPFLEYFLEGGAKGNPPLRCFFEERPMGNVFRGYFFEGGVKENPFLECFLRVGKRWYVF